VLFSQLGDDLVIRVWGENLASYKCYCFDFVNREHQYTSSNRMMSKSTPWKLHTSRARRFCQLSSHWKRRRGHRFTLTQLGVIPTGRLTSFLKAPLSASHSRTTRIAFFTYPCMSLMMPL
jgi:hypothetical protein